MLHFQHEQTEFAPQPSLWARVKAAVARVAAPATVAPEAAEKPTELKAAKPAPGMHISAEALAAWDSFNGSQPDAGTGANLSARFPRTAGSEHHGIELRERFPRSF